MKQKTEKMTGREDPLLQEVYNYLNKSDFHLSLFIQRKFKIGFF